MFWVGFPVSMQNAVSFLYNFVQSILAGQLGKNSLAANQVITQYSSLITSCIFANSEVNGILTGRDLSETKGLNLKNIHIISHLLSLVVPISFGLVTFPLLHKEFTSLFVDPSDESYETILSLTKWLFLINGFNNLFDGLRQSSSGFLQGFYDTAIPTFIMLLLLWSIGLPASLALTYPTTLGICGVLLGYTIGIATSTPILLKRSYDAANAPDLALKNIKEGVSSNLYGLFKNTFACCSRKLRNEPSRDLEDREQSEVDLELLSIENNVSLEGQQPPEIGLQLL